MDLKPEYIKIDGSIISGIVKNKDNQIILNIINYLAKQMNAATVAEFVESKEIQEIIVEYGISYSQGYYFAKPVPFEELNF